MQAKANGRQTLLVLLIAFVLIALCIGGLWAYVIGAETDTGIQEASAAELPEEARDTIVYDRYDEYPGGNDSYPMSDGEKRFLEKMQTAYAQGERPLENAPVLPEKTGFAIIPLNPDDYDGMTEYYIKPGRDFKEQELLQLIDHGQKNGVPFTSEMFSTKNCMSPGGDTINRYFSIGENARYNLLYDRYTREGLRPQMIPSLTFPISGVAKIPLNETYNGFDALYLYPLREMTDEELLQLVYLYMSDNDGLNPKDIGRDPIADVAWIRSLLENSVHLPLSAENTGIKYFRKDKAGQILVTVHFCTPLINGSETRYFVTADTASGRFLRLDHYTSYRNPNPPIEEQLSTESLHSRPWADIASTAINQLTGCEVSTAKVDGTNVIRRDEIAIDPISAMKVDVTMTNGDKYTVYIRLSDGEVDSLAYSPDDIPVTYW